MTEEAHKLVEQATLLADRDETDYEATVLLVRARLVARELEAAEKTIVSLKATVDAYNQRFKDDYQRMLDLWGELWRLADLRGESVGLAHVVADRGRQHVDGLVAEREDLSRRLVKAQARLTAREQAAIRDHALCLSCSSEKAAQVAKNERLAQERDDADRGFNRAQKELDAARAEVERLAADDREYRAALQEAADAGCPIDGRPLMLKVRNLANQRDNLKEWRDRLTTENDALRRRIERILATVREIEGNHLCEDAREDARDNEDGAAFQRGESFVCDAVRRAAREGE